MTSSADFNAIIAHLRRIHHGYISWISVWLNCQSSSPMNEFFYMARICHSGDINMDLAPLPPSWLDLADALSYGWSEPGAV